MKSLKIGMVCYPKIGGSGVLAANLGLELAKLGHEVHFISYEIPFKLGKKHHRIHFHKVPIKDYDLFKYPDYTLPLAVTIGHVHQKHQLDILHVHYAVPHATSALLARQFITLPPLVTTLHGTDITLMAHDPNLFDVIRYSIEKSDLVTTVSQSLKKETIKQLKTNKPIEVIHNFYSTPKITKSRALIRKELKLKETDFVAIHLSNLRPVKRIPDLLKIASKMKNNFKLLILAGGNFTPYLPHMNKNQVIIKENVKDIGNYINASDMGLYTSETESFGLAILETMSYGKTVLATNKGGIPEVIENEVSGFLFDVGDIEGFVKKIKTLMENRLELENIGKAAKKRAEKYFSPSLIVGQYLKLYQGLEN